MRLTQIFCDHDHDVRHAHSSRMSFLNVWTAMRRNSKKLVNYVNRYISKTWQEHAQKGESHTGNTVHSKKETKSGVQEGAINRCGLGLMDNPLQFFTFMNIQI